VTLVEQLEFSSEEGGGVSFPVRTPASIPEPMRGPDGASIAWMGRSMRIRCFVLFVLVACGGSSEPEPPEDGTPIVDRAPRPSHECAITHEAEILLESQPHAGNALARTGAGWVAARSAQDPETFQSQIALSELRFDPVELAAPQVEVAGAGYLARPELAERDGGLGLSWVAISETVAGQELRSAVLDDAGELVADPVTLHGADDEVTIATHSLVATADGFGILWSDDAALRFLVLDETGAPAGDPVTVTGGQVRAAHLVRRSDGFAAVWIDESGVQLVLLSENGAPRADPERLAGPGGEGTYLGDPFAVAVGDELVVAWTDSYSNQDFTDPDGGHALVRLARVGGDGALLGTAERLQAADDGIASALSSLLLIDGMVAVAWSRETFIQVCGGCISDATIRVLLIDPVDLVPVSDTVELVGPSGLKSAPMVGAEDGDVAFLLNVDYHAIADLAAAKIRCAPL
jgi:hypothetical protein